MWSDVETRTLLKIWGEQDIQAALEENFRNSFVYRDVSRRLGGMGFERTPEQCRMRIKSLKRQYLLAKEGNLRNNGQYHKICKFYDTMERILSNRPPHDPQEFIDSGPGGEEAADGMEEDAEDAQDGFSEGTTECSYPAETEVKLEYPTIPIPIPVKVTVGNSSKYLHSVMTLTFFSLWGNVINYIHALPSVLTVLTPGSAARPLSSSQSVSGLSARATKRPRKRRTNFPMEKLMEQFLEQSAQAEDGFYRMEEQRLQAEDRRREAEHARELHMLQMLGQMFSSISSARPGSSSSSSSTTTANNAVPASAPPPYGAVSCSEASHCQRASPKRDCLSQRGRLLSPDPQALGIAFDVM